MQDLDGGGEVVGCDEIDADTVLTSVEHELWGEDVVVMVGDDEDLDEAEEEVEEEHTDLGDTEGIL